MCSAHICSNLDYIYFGLQDIDTFVWQSLTQSATWLEGPISDILVNTLFYIKWIPVIYPLYCFFFIMIQGTVCDRNELFVVLFWGFMRKIAGILFDMATVYQL